MARAWMVRSGSGGSRISEFEEGYIGIGFSLKEDISTCKTKDELYSLYKNFKPNEKIGKIRSSVGQYYRFLFELDKGDHVVTYDSSMREYLVGTITGGYNFTKEGYPHRRAVDWGKRFDRDKLSVSARNSLGSTLTLFTINDDIWNEIEKIISGVKTTTVAPPDNEEEEEALEQIYADTVERAHELLKDKLLKLDDQDMEKLVAEILKAMGYKAKVSPVGPDRGVDVFASKDGLGFEEPRIKAEVKHRPKTQMGAPDLRSFIAGLRQGDRGMFVSTGGFSREAKYEADRAPIPVSLVDLDELANLIVENYENFDFRGRTMIKLTKLYWPVD